MRTEKQQHGYKASWQGQDSDSFSSRLSNQGGQAEDKKGTSDLTIFIHSSNNHYLIVHLSCAKQCKDERDLAV